MGEPDRQRCPGGSYVVSYTTNMAAESPDATDPAGRIGIIFGQRSACYIHWLSHAGFIRDEKVADGLFGEGGATVLFTKCSEILAGSSLKNAYHHCTHSALDI